MNLIHQAATEGKKGAAAALRRLKRMEDVDSLRPGAQEEIDRTVRFRVRERSSRCQVGVGWHVSGWDRMALLPALAKSVSTQSMKPTVKVDTQCYRANCRCRAQRQSTASIPRHGSPKPKAQSGI